MSHLYKKLISNALKPQLDCYLMDKWICSLPAKGWRARINHSAFEA